MRTLWTCTLAVGTGSVTDLRPGRACPQSCQPAGAAVLPWPLLPGPGLPGQSRRPPAWAQCGRPSARGPLPGGQEQQPPPLALEWLPRHCQVAPGTPQETGQTGSLLLHNRPHPLPPTIQWLAPSKVHNTALTSKSRTSAQNPIWEVQKQSLKTSCQGHLQLHPWVRLSIAAAAMLSKGWSFLDTFPLLRNTAASSG